METSGASVESDVSGSGSASFQRKGVTASTGSVYGTYTNDKLQADNLTDAWKSQDVSVSTYKKVADFVATGGGPIKQDRLWFLAPSSELDRSAAAWRVHSKDPASFVYTPDLERQAATKFDTKSVNARLTWQVSSNNRMGFFADKQPGGVSVEPQHAGRARSGHEPAVHRHLHRAGHWRSMVTKRLMLDVGATVLTSTAGRNFCRTFPIAFQFRSCRPAYAAQPDLVHGRAQPELPGKASLNYVTGSHAFKAGTSGEPDTNHLLQQLAGHCFRTVKRQAQFGLQIQTILYTDGSHLKTAVGLFAQDQWTIGRATLNMGIRMDHLNAYAAALNFTPVRYWWAHATSPRCRTHRTGPTSCRAWEWHGTSSAMARPR